MAVIPRVKYIHTNQLGQVNDQLNDLHQINTHRSHNLFVSIYQILTYGHKFGLELSTSEMMHKLAAL